MKNGNGFVFVEVPNEDGKLPSQRLRELMDALTRKTPMYDAIGDMMINWADENFRGQHAPNGTPWQVLTPATIRARMKRGRAQISILRETGLLRGSLNHVASEQGVSVGSSSIYGAIHQFGGTIDKKAGSRWMAGRRFAKRDKAPDGAEVAIRAHTITIPARPYIGVSKDQEGIIAEEVEDWLTR